MSGPEDILAGLDEDQRAAALAIDGPVAILAGAGTGKTRTITHRIAYGIAVGRFAPSRTMALTFTTRAAGELRTRLRALGAGEVSARTFHSAALSQLSYFWPQVIGGPVPRIQAAKAPLLAEVAARLGLPTGQAVLRDLAAEIEWRKASDMPIEEYAASGRRVAGLPLDAVVAVQRGYEDLKDERRLMDLEDVLLATAGMLAEEPQVAQAVREQYRTFVVDEYQDVSALQHRLLGLWLGRRRELCVVGDANQTIYGFAGATADFLLGFAREYPDATIVRLERSHRSAQPILDVANRLIRGRPGALELTAVARGSAPPCEDAAPVVEDHPDDRAEAFAIAGAVRAELEAGVEPQRVAILVRLNAQVPLIEDALRASRIPVAVRGDARFFEQPHVREAIVHLVAAKRTTPPDAPVQSTVRGVLAGLGWAPEEPAIDAPAAARERWAALDALHRLAVESAGPYSAFVDELLERQATKDEPLAGAVTIATIHSAKGLEWDAVHVAGVSEGLLPVAHATSEAEIEEERRLLYVAVTRARRALRLSWARRPGPGGPERAPSRFLADLGAAP